MSREKALCTCRNCGKSWLELVSQLTRGRGTFCSRDCQREYNSVEVTCFHCSKVFWRSKALAARSGRKHDYCSVSCYDAYRVKLVQKECVICRAAFLVEQYKADRITVCSADCQKANRKRLGKLQVKEREYRDCLVCGRAFAILPVNKDQKLCSPSCYHAWQSQAGIMAGENNHRWKGGTTSRTVERVRTTEWKRLADTIRAERGNICEVCGAEGNGKNLPVHHIVPWEISKDDSPANLLVTCSSCHAALDNTYYSTGLTPYTSPFSFQGAF